MESPKDLPAALAVTMGDPAGVGPEIVAAVLVEADELPPARLLVIGSEAVFDKARKLRGCSGELVRVSDGDVAACPAPLMFLDVQEARLDAEGMAKGRSDAASGKAAYSYVSRACELARAGVIAGIVTAPVSKEAVNLAGIDFSGHTEFIAERLGAGSFAMMLYSEELSVAFVTTHVPLIEVTRLVTVERIVEVCRLAEEFLARIGAGRRRIAVCGLNPHAGEGGFMGTGEREIIIPAIELSCGAGLDVEGPFPPDTMFRAGMRKTYDVAVAMYHDQGHIPFKMLAFEHGVNVTLGLPVVRTSVDHGTAFDIAWTGAARTSSLRAALALAWRMVGYRED